jgi:hypothetical protein
LTASMPLLELPDFAVWQKLCEAFDWPDMLKSDEESPTKLQHTVLNYIVHLDSALASQIVKNHIQTPTHSLFLWNAHRQPQNRFHVCDANFKALLIGVITPDQRLHWPCFQDSSDLSIKCG